MKISRCGTFGKSIGGSAWTSHGLMALASLPTAPASREVLFMSSNLPFRVPLASTCSQAQYTSRCSLGLRRCTSIHTYVLLSFQKQNRIQDLDFPLSLNMRFPYSEAAPVLIGGSRSKRIFIAMGWRQKTRRKLGCH